MSDLKVVKLVPKTKADAAKAEPARVAEEKSRQPCDPLPPRRQS